LAQKLPDAYDGLVQDDGNSAALALKEDEDAAEDEEEQPSFSDLRKKSCQSYLLP
jgi:hypothetical protein